MKKEKKKKKEEEEEEKGEMIIDPSGSKGSAWMVFLVVPPDEITLGEDEFEKQKECEEQGCGERLLNPSSFSSSSFFLFLSLSLSLCSPSIQNFSFQPCHSFSVLCTYFHVHILRDATSSLPSAKEDPTASTSPRQTNARVTGV